MEWIIPPLLYLYLILSKMLIENRHHQSSYFLMLF